MGYSRLAGAIDALCASESALPGAEIGHVMGGKVCCPSFPYGVSEWRLARKLKNTNISSNDDVLAVWCGDVLVVVDIVD